MFSEICEFFGTSKQSFVTVARDGIAPEGSVGVAFPGVDLRILDNHGQRAAVGEVGRVFVASELLFAGYEFGKPGVFRATATRSVSAMSGISMLTAICFDRPVGPNDRNPQERISRRSGSRPNRVYGRPAVLGVDDRRRGSAWSVLAAEDVNLQRRNLMVGRVRNTRSPEATFMSRLAPTVSEKPITPLSAR